MPQNIPDSTEKMRKPEETQQSEELSKEQLEKTKKYSIVDGSAYNVMYGFGEQYVAPYALKLGASNSDIAILSSVPAFIGSLFQVVGAKLTDNYRNRKKIVTLFVMLQAIMFLPLFIVPFFTKSMLLLTIIFSVYLMCANAAGPGWNSWMGEIIPENDRATYFSRRNRITLVFLVLSVLFAGIILNYFVDTNIWIGFGILFGIAFIGRIVSWTYLSKQFEPKYRVYEKEHFTFKDFLSEMPKTNFGNFVIFRSLMALAVMIASPFFVVYMLKDLNFTYIQYTIIVLAPMLIKILTTTYWGKYSDRFGTRNIMIVSALLIGVIPIGWFIAGYFFFGHAIIFYIIMLSEMISGFAWAGFELTTFNYIFETVIAQKRAKSIAYFNIFLGTATLIGGLAGGWLAITLPTEYHGISILLMVFLISAVARFLVPILFMSKLKEVRVKKSVDEKKLFVNLVISRPFHSVLHHTAQAMFFAEKSLSRMTEKTSNGLKTAKKPLDPIITGVIDRLDKGLDRIEPLRKALEPQAIRKNKKSHYEHLVNQDYERYVKTHPKIVRKLRKKDNRRTRIR